MEEVAYMEEDYLKVSSYIDSVLVLRHDHESYLYKWPEKELKKRKKKQKLMDSSEETLRSIDKPYYTGLKGRLYYYNSDGTITIIEF